MTLRLDTRLLVAALKAAAEPTRLRILLLLRAGELNVKDLTEILGQSQPRISRHLKLLAEAGLVERFRDGSWVYFHVSDRTTGGRLTLRLLDTVETDDPVVARDLSRAEALKRDREASAQAYFRTHAGEWDKLRGLHVSERDVESTMLQALGSGPFELLVDMGAGTGRILEVMAGRYKRGLGFDVNQSMLELARAKLTKAGLTQAQLRHGDIYHLPLADHAADVIIMHQVLHYLSEPHTAIAEAARVLAPGGKLLIADFAPHSLEFLREKHAHERLGFARDQVNGWISEAGLKPMQALDLAPSKRNGGDKLTVSIWVAERAGEPADKAAKGRKLERVAL